MDNGLISVNGEISSADQARIPAMDRGLLFGDNVFEVLVGFGKQLLDVAPHLQRLRLSAENLEIPVPWSDAELLFEMEALADQISTRKKYLRLVITRGVGLGLGSAEEMYPNKYLYAFPAKIEPAEYLQNGIALKLKRSPIIERGPNPKTGNYLRSILAMRAANREGFQDVLWSNAEGEITEASTANIFFLGREGDLVEVATPTLQSGILSGITRGTLIRILNQAKIPVTERVIYHDEIPRFDEAFLCSTVRGLMPITKIDRHVLRTTRPNSTFQHFQRLFNAHVHVQLGYAVDWNTGVKL
jgi:branched-subunit amino acid aminotransferase/4-amino-4-deoxychorismate lyase